MSVMASAWAWHDSPAEVRGNDLLVLLALADVADDTGECVYLSAADATEEALAKKCRMSSRTFRRTLRALEESGCLSVARESAHSMNRYSLALTGQLVRSNSPVNLSGESGQSVRSDRPTVSGHKTYLRKEEASLLPSEPKRKKPEVVLPVGWAPSSVHVLKAGELGLDVEAEAEAFRLHAETHDRRVVNWNAAFSMWLTKARGFAGPVPAGSPPPKKSKLTPEQRAWLRDRWISEEEYLDRKDEPGFMDWLIKMQPREIANA